MCTVATPAACLIRAYAQAARTAAPKTVAESQPARDSLAKSARFSLGKRSAAIQEQMHLDAVLPALGQGNVVCPISGLGPLNLGQLVRYSGREPYPYLGTYDPYKVVNAGCETGVSGAAGSER